LNSSLNGDYTLPGRIQRTQPITIITATRAAKKTAVDNAYLTRSGMSQQVWRLNDQRAYAKFLDTQFASLFQNQLSPIGLPRSSQSLTNQIRKPNGKHVGQRQKPGSSSLRKPIPWLPIWDSESQFFGYQAVSQSAQSFLTSAISNLTDLQRTLAWFKRMSPTPIKIKCLCNRTFLSNQIGISKRNTYEFRRGHRPANANKDSYALTSQLAQLSLVKFL